MDKIPEKYKKNVDKFWNIVFDNIYENVSTFFRNAKMANKDLDPLDFNYGLHIRPVIGESECSIGIDLDHINDDKIVELINNGKLSNEIMTLYILAHLPFVQVCTKTIRIDDEYFNMVDRVIIYLNNTFHPLDRTKYNEHTVREKSPFCETYDSVERFMDWFKRRHNIP